VAILVAEELDLLYAEYLRRGALLFLADGDQLRVLLLGILATLPAIRHDHIDHVGTAVRQARDRASRPEVGIVWVSGDDEDSFELRKPAVAAWAGHFKTA